MGTISSQFAYAVGRIHVLDTKLLNQNELERMLGAKNAKEAYRVLNETNFASHIGDIEKIESFEEVLKAGLLDAKKLLTEISPDNVTLNILWYAYDIHNIKTLLKAKLRGKPLEEIQEHLIGLGAIPEEIWIATIYKEEKMEIPIPQKHTQTILDAISRAKKAYEKGSGIQAVDLILDAAYWQLAAEMANKSGNEFMKKFIQNSIDIANITAVLRIKFEGRDKNLLESVLMEGGGLEKEELLKRFQEDEQEIAKGTPYDRIVQQGVDFLRDTGSFLELERMLENFKIEFIKEAKYVTYGPEPLIAHFWAIVQNSIIIRTVMVGKLNGVEANTIRERLRNLYTS